MSQENRTETRASIEEFHGERSKKLLKCSVDATAHMKEYIKHIKERMAQGDPIIWNWGTPEEILHCMDILHVPAIYYSALISAKQMSRYYLDRLNSESYFRDLCRYCTVPLGYAFDQKPEIAPWGGLPKFAAVIAGRNDDPTQKIFELYAREFDDVPFYHVDSTYMARFPRTDKWWDDWRAADVETESHRVESRLEELEGQIRFLETVTGKHFSLSKLRQMVERKNKECEYWWKATDLSGVTKPCPISWTDALSNVSACLYFSGMQWAVDHARKYYEEIKERADKGIGACENERVRLMWEGHPVWFSLGFYNAFEEKYGAIFLPEYYFSQTETWIRRDPSDPLRALASRSVHAFPSFFRIPTTRSQWELYLTGKYKVDGVVYMLVESCKLLYTGVQFAREALEKAGVPTMEINADMVDARDWDDTKMKSLVSSFIETVAP